MLENFDTATIRAPSNIIILANVSSDPPATGIYSVSNVLLT